MPLSDAYNKRNGEYIEASRAKKDSATLAGMRAELDAIREKMEPYYEQMDVIDKKFINDNPGSFVTAYLLRFRISGMTLPKRNPPITS